MFGLTTSYVTVLGVIRTGHPSSNRSETPVIPGKVSSLFPYGVGLEVSGVVSSERRPGLREGTYTGTTLFLRTSGWTKVGPETEGVGLGTGNEGVE